MKEWEKEVPLGIAVALRETKDKTVNRAVVMLEKREVPEMTSISRIREIARGYSRRYKVPIRISSKPFREHPESDAIHRYEKGRSTIYLHPILQYYPERYIRGTIEHEIDHMHVEQKWEGEL